MMLEWMESVMERIVQAFVYVSNGNKKSVKATVLMEYTTQIDSIDDTSS